MLQLIQTKGEGEMSFEIWSVIAVIAFILCAAMMVVSIILFVRLDIKSVWRILSSKKARKRYLREENTVMPGAEQETTILGTEEETAVLGTEEETTLLKEEENATTLLVDNGFDVIEDIVVVHTDTNDKT